MVTHSLALMRKLPKRGFAMHSLRTLSPYEHRELRHRTGREFATSNSPLKRRDCERVRQVIVLDENVSLALASALREAGHGVIALAETAGRGMTDTEVWELARARRAILITRDHGFTNPVRFRAQEVEAVIYVRRGNLRSEEEVVLVMGFLAAHELDEYKGRLVTLWPGGTRIR